MVQRNEDTPQVVDAELVHRVGFTLRELETIAALVRTTTDKVTDRAFTAEAGEQEKVDATWWRAFNRKMQDRAELARSRDA